jgi:hypothetical protein
MPRLSGLERREAPFGIRWIYGRSQNLFGKEFWGGTLLAIPQAVSSRRTWSDVTGRAARRRSCELPVLNEHRLCREQNASESRTDRRGSRGAK